MDNYQHLSGIIQKDKNGFIYNNILTLFKKKSILDGIFAFLCMHSVRNYQRQRSIFDLIQFKYFTLRHVCNTLDNKVILKQNYI